MAASATVLLQSVLLFAEIVVYGSEPVRLNRYRRESQKSIKRARKSEQQDRKPSVILMGTLPLTHAVGSDSNRTSLASDVRNYDEIDSTVEGEGEAIAQPKPPRRTSRHQVSGNVSRLAHCRGIVPFGMPIACSAPSPLASLQVMFLPKDMFLTADDGPQTAYNWEHEKGLEPRELLEPKLLTALSCWPSVSRD